MLVKAFVSPPFFTVKAPHFNYLLCGKLALWMAFATACAPFLTPQAFQGFSLRLHTAFFDSISGVVPCGAEKEVLWIHTGRIVSSGTVVHNVQSLWDRTVEQFPSIPVSARLFPVQREVTMSCRCFGAFPYPAPVWSEFHQVPKPLLSSSSPLLSGPVQSPPLWVWKFIDPSLQNPVCAILERRAEEKVVRIATGWTVALVADELARWNWSFVYEPHESVSGHVLPIAGGASITCLIKRTGEKPTTVRSGSEFGPESNHILRGGNHSKMLLNSTHT